MKVKLIVGCLLICFFAKCGRAQDRDGKLMNNKDSKDSTIFSNRLILKEYFLCVCIDNGFKESGLLSTKDHSTAILGEIANYHPDVFEQMDSLARYVVNRIPVSNLTGKRGIMINCIEYYNGEQLDSFVKKLDKKMHVFLNQKRRDKK